MWYTSILIENYRGTEYIYNMSRETHSLLPWFAREPSQVRVVACTLADDLSCRRLPSARPPVYPQQPLVSPALKPPLNPYLDAGHEISSGRFRSSLRNPRNPSAAHRRTFHPQENPLCDALSCSALLSPAIGFGDRSARDASPKAERSPRLPVDCLTGKRCFYCG